MSTEYRKYSFKKYEYGWMVFSTTIKGTDERMEMCFANEQDALAYTLSLNASESKRVEEMEMRMEEAKKRLSIPATPYYSITGYFGD